MIHIEPKYQIRLSVESSDEMLLNSLEAELPVESDEEVSPEFSLDRMAGVEFLGEGEERLTGRVTFEDTEDNDGNITTSAETAALDLYDVLAGYDLSG